jgi:hypothetical protein
MCSYEHLPHVEHSKGDSRPARRTRSVKAKPGARLECSPKTSLGSFRAGEHCNSATGSEDIRCGRRSLGTCFDQILPDSERGDKKSMLIGSSIPGRDHQGGMQKRLRPRSSGIVESPRSGRRSDSELIRMSGRYRRTIQKKNLVPLSYRDSTATGSADQLEHCANTWTPARDRRSSTPASIIPASRQSRPPPADGSGRVLLSFELFQLSRYWRSRNFGSTPVSVLACVIF